MISVKKAQQLVVDYTSRLDELSIPLSDGLGKVLAKDIHAPIHQPPFRQSAMDGYAIIHTDLTGPGITLEVTGESAAGTIEKQRITPGRAMRIFTGAPVPDGATAVVMQERTSLDGNKLSIEQNEIAAGTNIRDIGDEIDQGQLALEKGDLLTPAGIGFLSTLGIASLEVIASPKIGVIITGNELVEPGNALKYGQIYESNLSTLSGALQSSGFNITTHEKLQDHFDQTLNTLSDLGKDMDVIIVSGGISVGDYDFVGKALQELNAQEYFYKVRQKPGKPLYFGKLNKALVFALPGNPASMLCCYYEYVLPALRKMKGYKEWFLETRTMRLSGDYSCKADRAHFLKGLCHHDVVEILDGQSSFMLQSFSRANCLVYIPEGTESVKAGQEVEIHLLP